MVPAEPSSGRAQVRELDNKPPVAGGWQNLADIRTLDMDFEVRRVRARSASVDPAADNQQELGDEEKCMYPSKNRSSPNWTSPLPSPFPGFTRRPECKLPSLLSFKASDSLPNLELSLGLEGSQPRSSSRVCPSASVTDGPVKLEQFHPWFGPFPSTCTKVEEEPALSPPSWDQSSVVCNLSPSTLPIVSSNRGEGTLDLFSERQGMPSSEDQMAVACTIDKVKMALQRTLKNSPPMKSCPTGSTVLQPSTCGKKRTLPSFPLLQVKSKKAAPAAASSPTTSDASSSVSCKSSLHSSGSGGYGSCPDAEDRSNMLPSGSTDYKANEEMAPRTVVIMGCTKCQMYFMVSKDNRSCSKCGTVMLDVPAPGKRQREADV